MSAGTDMTAAASRPDRTVLWASLGGTIGLFCVMQVIAFLRAGGIFEYPLDDVYIHLAMASGIMRGEYGVNPGEYSSAASSALYPVLLTPFPDTEFQRLLPLFWNAVAVSFSGLLIARIQTQSGLPERVSGGRLVIVALLLPIALNVAVVGLAGLENALHTTASLAVLSGLIAVAQGGRVTWLLVLGIVLGPLLRFEGMAISLLACAYAGWFVRPSRGVLLAAGAIVPVLLFCALLIMLDIGPLPNSVMAKLSEGIAVNADFTTRILRRFAGNVALVPGTVLLGFTLLASALIFLSQGMKARALAAVAVLAGFAHLALGRIGWMDRYENYVLVFVAMASIHLLATGVSARIRQMGAIAVLIGGAVSLAVYQGNFASRIQYGPGAIHLQHAQMARFAQDYADMPVAVNDLGRVVWGNDNYVLDLWGLASQEALHVRMFGAEQGWGDPLVEKHDVGLAMVYDRWMAEAAGPQWQRLGMLRHNAPAGLIGWRDVTFYATRPEYVAPLTEALDRFVPTLPQGTEFIFEQDAEASR